ncbi:hypothetical protein V7S43_010131 [Phytophthora oleae]|uniref:Uncharacterized protein n=1 Tax=Phytophthora oleae TaxID=2107226 RepID=A0ABD3FGH9_9STRA
MAIAIELRADVYQLGLKMIGKNVQGRRVLSRLQFFCKDVDGVELSRCLPFQQATIVYWNNLLFQPSVIEIVKEQLSYMDGVRFFISSVRMCPRHRESCFSGFCSTCELVKELGLPCSWKAYPQQVFVYRSKLAF